MKIRFVAMIVFSIAVQIPGQTIISAVATNQVSTTNVQSTPNTIVKRGANSRTWERTTYEKRPSGEVLAHVHRVVELATGLNYTNSQTGQLMSAREEIDILPDGTAAATQGQHQAYFPADIYTGVVEVVTPDGQHLKSRPIGISYDNGSNTVLIAQIKDCTGEIVGSNQVIYPDAFTGLKADLRYTYTKAGFEQDVILRQIPPAPDSYGLTKARMQLLTEFFDATNPVQKTVQTDSSGLTDTELAFGAMRMQQGRAFSIGTGTNSQNQIPVCKCWANVGGRTLLVEELQYDSIKGQLQRLPIETAKTMELSTQPALCKISRERLLPPLRIAQETQPKSKGKKSKTIRFAKADPAPGFVLDYIVLNGNNDSYTFGPGTYFISGPVVCNNATLQGGAVIKYPNDTTAYVQFEGTPLVCDTGPYNPAVFTAADDDSVGESVGGAWNGYTGSIQPGGYANPAIQIDGYLHGVRICYAKQAVAGFWGAGFTIADSQIVNCCHGLSLTWQNGVANVVNCLFANPTIDAVRGGGSGSAFNLYFCTVDNCPQFSGTGDDGSTAESVRAVDSIFSSIGGFGYGTQSGGYNGFCNIGGSTFGDNPITADDPTTIYDTVDGWWYEYQYANYYLYGGSSFSQVGTTDPAYITDPTVLADIGKKVTSFPQVFDGSDQDLTLGPALAGDASATPDLGYHYDRIDYLFGNFDEPVDLSAHLTVAPGTVVTWGKSQGGTGGIMLEPGSRITFQGTEQSPSYFIRGNTVWEQDTGGDVTGIASSSYSPIPEVDANFTRFSAVDNFGALGSAGGSLSFSATNCEFWNVSFGAYVGFALNLFNCLLVDNSLGLGPPPGAPSSSFTMVNCTEVNGSIEIFRYSSGPSINVNVTNSAFDGTAITVNANNYGSVFCNNNAYLTGSNTLPNDSADVIVTNFNWQSGLLGNYYLPNDPPAHDGTLLIDAGSQSGQVAQLFHYTTQTNQTMEANSTVDIGYHYVALGSDGNPPTTGVQGVPDYQIDSVLPQISITAPANNSSFGTMRVNVTGTFNDAYLKQIAVNGIVAFTSGNTFEALNVPLAAGANTVTATIADLVGKTATASITVNESGTPVDPVQLTAAPVAGFSPLSVTFQMTSSAPGTLLQVLYDFDGDGVAEQTATDLNPISHTYSTSGEYFPVVTLVTTVGRFSSLGGWSSVDPGRLRVNAQIPPVLQNTVYVTDPVDLKCDSSGNLYVLSGSTATIFEYSSTGTLLRSLAGIGTSPSGLDVDSMGNVYVAISGNNQVLKFTPTTLSFQLDSTFGNNGHIGNDDQSPGTGNGQFNAPFDVAVYPDGTQIAVSDSGNNRIQQFTKSGAFVNVFGQVGDEVGQFQTPKGLAFDDSAYLYIVDSGNNRVDVAYLSAVVAISGSFGNSLGQFQQPVNLGIGSRAIYVADTQNNRVQQFDPLSRWNPTFSSSGSISSIPGQMSLNQPSAVAEVDNLLNESLYIADRGNNKIVLINLPIDNPSNNWNVMMQHLAAQNITDALTNYSEGTVDQYRQAFVTLGAAAIANSSSQIGSLTPVFILNDKAQYRFDKSINGTTVTFPVDFVKENGIWKIEGY